MECELKLFVWEDVLCDYSCGIMFALARTADEARMLIVYKDGDKPVEEYVEWRKWRAGLDEETCWYQVWVALEAEPRVVDQLEGFILQGGS